MHKSLRIFIISDFKDESPKSIRVERRRWVKGFIRLGKPNSLIRYVTDRPGHDRRYAIDASRIITELGWHPSVSFEDGINKTIDWYLQNKDWLANVVSGDYRKYYDSMYSNR